MENEIIRLEDISKAFDGREVLNRISLEIVKGEIHVIIGKNGSGKSTLMKILSGVYRQDSGEIYLQGNRVEINSPQQAQNLGISMVFQECNLFPNMDIARNIFLNNEPLLKWVYAFDDKKMVTETEKLFQKFNIELDPRTMVKHLRVPEQKLLQLIKALQGNPQVLILDEVMIGLTQKENDILLRVIQKLKEDGTTVIYISHRLDEMLKIGDRVTVINGGRAVASMSMAEVDRMRL